MELSGVYKLSGANLGDVQRQIGTFLDVNKAAGQKNSIMSSYKTFQGLAVETQGFKVKYDEKGKLLDGKRTSALPEMDVATLQVGKKEFSVVEFNDLIMGLQHQVPCIDIRSIIGNFIECDYYFKGLIRIVI